MKIDLYTYIKACYKLQSVEDLREALNRPVNHQNLAKWGTTEEQYREWILEAILEKNETARLSE